MGHRSEAPALVQSLGTSVGVAEPADHAGHSSAPSEVSSRPLATPLAGTWLEGRKALDEMDRWRPHFAFSLGECCFPFLSRGGGVFTGASEMDPTELDEPPSNPGLAKAPQVLARLLRITWLQVSWEQQNREEKKREKEREHLGEDFPHVAKALRPAWHDCLWVSFRDGGRVVPLSTARVTGLELALEFTRNGVQTRTVYQLSDVNKIRNTLTLGEEVVFLLLLLLCFCFYLTRKRLQILRI